jgi:hypothetical protein
MNARALALVTLLIDVAICSVPLSAQTSTNQKYDDCSNLARQVSGWNGAVQNPSKNAPLRGAAGGAIGGSLIGGMGGGDAGRGAAIGAAFGAAFGAARKSQAAAAQQSAENAYYSTLNQCLSQP